VEFIPTAAVPYFQAKATPKPITGSILLSSLILLVHLSGPSGQTQPLRMLRISPRIPVRSRRFSSPVVMTLLATYVISYYAHGNYAVDQYYASGWGATLTLSLTLPQTPTDARNWLFLYRLHGDSWPQLVLPPNSG
jgi:hypothetical protein